MCQPKEFVDTAFNRMIGGICCHFWEGRILAAYVKSDMCPVPARPSGRSLELNKIVRGKCGRTVLAKKLLDVRGRGYQEACLEIRHTMVECHNSGELNSDFGADYDVGLSAFKV